MRKMLIAAPLLLGACVSGPDRGQVLNSLIGQPETAAVQVLGVPSRTYEAEGHKFLAYTEQRSQVIDRGPFLFGGFGGFGYGPGFGPGFGYGGFFPSEVVVRGCETTLDVVGGVVRTWALRGNAC